MQPLLEHLARFDRAHHAANIGHMRTRGGKSDQPAVAEYRLGNADIRQMSGALPRVVGDVDIAVLHSAIRAVRSELAEEVPHRRRQRADK